MGEADVHIPQGSEIGQVVTVFALQLGKKERRKTVCREGYGLIVPWRLRGHFIPYRSRGPDPAGAHHLFSLATAGLVQNGAPLDLGLVISVDGVCDVQGILEDLPSGSVHHGLPSGGVLGNPGNEDDLVSLALTTTEIVLDIISSVARRRVTIGILGRGQLLAEDFVIGFPALLLDNNLLHVIGDLVDHILDLSAAHAEFIECFNALIVDGDTRCERHDCLFR